MGRVPPVGSTRMLELHATGPDLGTMNMSRLLNAMSPALEDSTWRGFGCSLHGELCRGSITRNRRDPARGKRCSADHSARNPETNRGGRRWQKSSPALRWRCPPQCGAAQLEQLCCGERGRQQSKPLSPGTSAALVTPRAASRSLRI